MLIIRPRVLALLVEEEHTGRGFVSRASLKRGWGLVVMFKYLSNRFTIMAGTAFERRIFDELAHIKDEIDEIREHMVDVDTIISEEERILINQSFEHEKEGKLVSLTEFEK